MKEYVKKTVLFIIPVLLLLLLPINSSAYNMKEQKNILVLNSYNEDMDWTRGLTAGITDKVRQNEDNIFLSFEYMDWKNYPTQDNLDFLHDYYSLKYEEKTFDVVIVSDDMALLFALKNRDEIFHGSPIVFCGVNEKSLSNLDSSYDNYTGVIEVADPTETIKMAKHINPSLSKIYLIYDNFESGITTANMFKEKIDALNMGYKIISLNQLGFHDLLTQLSVLDDQSIVLYATYNSDGKGNIIEYNIGLKQICEYSRVPVYHQYMFGLADGAFGGNLTSPDQYGEYAAELAIRIINGERADDISIVSPDVAKKVVNYDQLIKLGIPLDAIPEDVELINKPFSFFETYKMLVEVVTIIIAFLIILVILLLIHNRKMRKMKKKNTYLAMHDVLTGLPNRRSLYEDETKLQVEGLKNYSALLFLDLDNFKYINDTMGHEFGDEFICEVSKRLLKNMRENFKIYRLGGDEFVILMLQVSTSHEVNDFVNLILEDMKSEFVVLGSSLKISASIGVALYPEHGVTVEELIKFADIAMYKAKEGGKNRSVIYEKTMNQDFTDRMIIERHLNFAIENKEFEVYYQPQIKVETQKVTGLEALLRWNNKELGTVPPLRFIEIAEITRLIIPIGDWVFHQACMFAKKLQESRHADVSISVNISVIQILQTDFTQKILDTLKDYDLNPDCLELEITETVMAESIDVILSKLQYLSDHGIRIALDDFGKGYSSLNYLIQLPIKTLKIDKSFIDNISTDKDFEGIVSHIINMGKSLGMSIIAEGVEKEEQLNYLRKYNCETIQGYYFSPPLSQEDVMTFLENK